MTSCSYSFSLPEVRKQCEVTQAALQSDDELFGALTSEQIAYWSAFIQKVNEDWKNITDNPSYLSQEVMDTVVLLNSVEELKAMIHKSKAISSMLWIREGLSTQRIESPAQSSESAANPYLTPYRSTYSRDSKFRKKGPSHSFSHLDRTFSNPSPLSPIPPADDILSRCEKAQKGKCFNQNDIAFWTKFIEQADSDWATALNNEAYWDHTLMETLLLLKAEDTIWSKIEQSRASLAILWIYIGLCYEAERTRSEVLSSPHQSPLQPMLKRTGRIISPHVKRNLMPEFERNNQLKEAEEVISSRNDRIRELEKQLKEAREASICSWPVVAISLISFALGAASMGIWKSFPPH